MSKHKKVVVKKKINIVLLIVFLILALTIALVPLLAGGFKPALGQTPQPVDITDRLSLAEELTPMAVCPSLTPAVEGVPPVEMAQYDDWTRQATCITQTQVKGVGWSAFAGSYANPLTHFYAWWRLIDVSTNAVLAETKVDIQNNPITMGPPSAMLQWLKPCGPAKNLLLLLDIFSHQIVGGQEVGLSLRDHSWHFPLPSSPCKLYMPFINTFVQPVVYSCPTNVKMRLLSPHEGDFLLNFSQPADVRDFTIHLYVGETITFIFEVDGHETILPYGGELTITGPDRTFEYTGISRVTLKGGTDLGLYTYTVEASFHYQGLRCSNLIYLWDPIAPLAKTLIAINPGLSWDDAYAQALNIYSNRESNIDMFTLYGSLVIGANNPNQNSQ
jgi:hypothetical protein